MNHIHRRTKPASFHLAQIWEEFLADRNLNLLGERGSAVPERERILLLCYAAGRGLKEEVVHLTRLWGVMAEAVLALDTQHGQEAARLVECGAGIMAETLSQRPTPACYAR